MLCKKWTLDNEKMRPYFDEYHKEHNIDIDDIQSKAEKRMDRFVYYYLADGTAFSEHAWELLENGKKLILKEKDEIIFEFEIESISKKQLVLKALKTRERMAKTLVYNPAKK